jgi:hypothetical protein
VDVTGQLQQLLIVLKVTSEGVRNADFMRFYYDQFARGSDW